MSEFLLVREEAAGDEAAVYRVNEAAFGRPEEARLVDALRGAVQPSVSLVATLAGEVVGHIFFEPVTIEGASDHSGAMALAPVAVLPERQGAGVGSALVRAGLEACRKLGEDVVFVLGHRGYYPRFGFQLAAPLGLQFAERGAERNFFVLELEPGALRGRTGRVRYPEAFDGL